MTGNCGAWRFSDRVAQPQPEFVKPRALRLAVARPIRSFLQWPNSSNQHMHMFIADAQVHIWAPETPERPWRPGYRPKRAVALEAKDLLAEMDAAGVRRAVLVPPYVDCERNDLVLAAARRYPDRFAVMGRLDTEPPGARDEIATWLAQPGMLGLRCSFNRPHLASALEDGRVDWLWAEAEKAGVPIMALVPHSLLHLIDRVAGRHPQLKLALCHFSLADNARDDEAFRDFEKLIAVARRPNVAVKASALPCYTSDSYPFRKLHPYIRRVYDAFGPKRMFWGSDLSRLPCAYRECVGLFTDELPWLPAHDLEWIMGRGLCEWLEWRLPSQ
jgi:L-fuconolactonase